MEQVKTDHNELRIGVNVFIFIEIILLTVLTFYSLLHTGYTTNDDTLNALRALSQDKSAIVSSLAERQGRFQFLLNVWIFMTPYMFNNFICLKIISIGSLILNLLVFMWFSQVYLKSVQFTTLAGILYLLAIQNSWNHNILTSYPFGFHLGFSLLLLSFIFLKSYLNSLKRSRLVCSVIFFTLSLFIYETFCLYILIFPLLTLSHYSESDISFKKKLLDMTKVVSPYMLAVLVYATIYLIYRSYFPGSYDGVKIAPFSLILFFNVIYKYSISSFPTYLYFFSNNILKLYSDAFGGYNFGLMHIIQNARVEWIIKSILAGWGVYICFFKMQNIIWSIKKLYFTLMVSFLLIVIPNILYGITPKYQKWVEGGSPAFVGTYFSYFGMILLLASLILYFKELTLNNPVINKIYTIVIMILVICTSLITDFENYAVAKSQTLSQYKWVIFDNFLETDEFMSLPDGSLIFAPSLWIGLVANQPTYWTNYVKINSSKNIVVTRNTDDLKSFVLKNGNHNNVYYLKYSQDPKESNQFLVFSKVEDLKIVCNNVEILSNNANIYTLSRNRRFMVLGNVINDGRQNVIAIDEKRKGSSTGDHFGYLINKENESEAFNETRLSSELPFDLPSITLSNYLDYSPSHLPLYKLDSEICFADGGNAVPYQLSGWSNAEKNFTWTNGKKASLCIPISQTQNDLVLKVKMSPLIGGSVTSQKVHVFLGEKQLGVWDVAGKGEYTIEIPNVDIKDSVLEITFEMPNAITPKELNINNDLRTLGVAVQSLVISEKS